MKICDISSFFSEQGGGVRTYHYAKQDYFASHPEHEYILIAAGDRNRVEEMPGGRVYYVRGFPVSRNGIYRQIYDFTAIRKILREEKPDVIESGSPYLDGWLSLAGRRGWKPANVGFYHADFPDSYMAPAVRGIPRPVSKPFVDFWKRYVRLAYSPFDATVVTTDYIDDKLKGYGLKNTTKIPLGVDSERFNPSKASQDIRAELGIRPDQKLVLYVGRFGTEKGIESMLEAVELMDGREDLSVIIVGDGPLDKRIRRAIDKTKVARVHGFESDRDRLAAIYASADIFLAPGPYETFGLSVLEALSSGVPVVGAQSGGGGEMLKASGAGVGFKANDSASLVAAVDEILTKDLEPMKRKARQFVEGGFSWDRTFDKMVTRYEEIVDAKRSGNSIHT